MQQQQPQNRFARILPIYLIITAIYFLVLQYVMPKPGANSEQGKTVIQQAQSLEAEGRKEDPNVALAERVKKLEKAAAKYEEAFNAAKDKPEGWQARFQQVNIYDYLARLESKTKPTNTHWYDQAEQKLKDMEGGLHGKRGTVPVEGDGKVESRTGDLGEIAAARLNEIRAARDVVNRPKWTYIVLDWLVAMTGKNPAFSYAFALALVVVFLKVITFPFQKKQYEYQRDMMRVQPLIKELQEKMKGRPAEEMQRRQMEIFKENNVNMLGGCLPMLVMMFVLFPVFWMVKDYEYQFTNATFIWIGSAASKASPWLADNLAQFDVPMFVIYLLSTLGMSMLQPKPSDPQQAQQQKMMLYMMPLTFGIMMFFYRWSSAFMLYWLILNLVSAYQSWILGRQFGLFGGGGASSGGGGGGIVTVEPPASPLAPMKGLTTKPASAGRSDRGNPRAVPGRVRPKGTGRRG
jgi:YidC/Oxa1 family membrane protein insertase